MRCLGAQQFCDGLAKQPVFGVPERHLLSSVYILEFLGDGSALLSLSTLKSWALIPLVLKKAARCILEFIQRIVGWLRQSITTTNHWGSQVYQVFVACVPRILEINQMVLKVLSKRFLLQELLKLTTQMMVETPGLICQKMLIVLLLMLALLQATT